MEAVVRRRFTKVWLGRRTASGRLPPLITGWLVGPHYTRPEMAQPEQFRSQISPADATSFADLAWWQVFNDKALQSLISDALAHNYDLQVAVARIEQARAVVGQAKSEGLPQIGYQAGG